VDARLDTQLHPDTDEVHRNHQKAVFIKLAKSSHLFVGGMDVSTDRVGWIDVQAEVIGAGAILGSVTLEERWESVDPFATRVPTTERATPAGDDKPKHHVQFVRTYAPFPTDPKVLKTWRRTNAKRGDHTYYALLSRAIAAAKKSIYIEEQFFWPMIEAPKRTHDLGGSKPRLRSDVPDIPATLEKLLAEAIGRGVKLVVIGPNYDDMPNWKKTRSQMAQQLRSKKNPPWLLTMPPDTVFVHSKVWIFDDEFVVIGSANVWDKSLVSTLRPAEGEFGVGFTSTADGTALGFPKATFARSLRVRMWERVIQSLHVGFSFPRKLDNTFADEAKELTKPIKGKPVLIPM
jgi:phosphatidylserine/phosphatidylglycerophosphate/cardiolipin synthase-like enzyme